MSTRRRRSAAKGSAPTKQERIERPAHEKSERSGKPKSSRRRRC